MADDPRALNDFAWALLTDDVFAERFDGLAGEFALAANEASGYSVWQYLDTLALARFRAGEVESAIEIQEKALGLVEASADRPAVEASLARFRRASKALAEEAGHR